MQQLPQKVERIPDEKEEVVVDVAGLVFLAEVAAYLATNRPIIGVNTTLPCRYIGLPLR
jgi:hypothetical protein